MELNALTAIAPSDGRYRNKTEKLAAYFSEFALIRYRVKFEIEYFIELCELPLPQLQTFDKSHYSKLRAVYENFSLKDAEKIKEIERVTNHDVKAVEYFIKEVFEKENLGEFKEFIHFGLTSQDINNTATPMMIADALREVYLPELKSLINALKEKTKAWKDVPMLARTHGQPASPTVLGKEIQVFVYRLEQQTEELLRLPADAKFGGATGNFNAHLVAYPDTDWESFGNRLLLRLGLKRSPYTTQIANYDFLAAFFDAMKRVNVILLDLARDFWTYISMDYFKQKIKAGEVGSSAMPHKVNPIDFENGEGNIGIANALFEHLAAKLPVSRLQRDLTDSTVLRAVGLPVSHSLIAFKSIMKGLGKVELNESALRADLENNWAVVAEAIQTILRREAYPNPYEELKALTRKNEKITEESISQFIESLKVSEEVKKELRQISPYNYTGRIRLPGEEPLLA